MSEPATPCRRVACDRPATMAMKVREGSDHAVLSWTTYPSASAAPAEAVPYCKDDGLHVANALIRIFVDDQ